jgi:hypothetical protein
MTTPKVLASWHAGEIAPRDLVAPLGTKAHGLLTLPRAWVPPFVALDALAIQQYQVAEAEIAELTERSHAQHVLLRSDGPNEVAIPGMSRSEIARADPASVMAALAGIRSFDAPTGAVVQPAIEPALLGLMSNERRVTPDQRRWVIEGELDLHGPNLYVVGATSSRGVRRTGPLLATSPNEVRARLSVVAGRLIEQGRPRRVEWLWDGERVWIVQADILPPWPAPTQEPPGPPAASPFQPGRSPLRGATQFDGRKVARWRTFADLDWPRPEMLIIVGDRWQQENVPERLAEMGSGPFVVRTDIRESVVMEDLLLPTSDPARGPRQVLRFMKATAARFVASGLAGSDWAFLVAALVPCQASALVLAEPETNVARVDALWGYPDGLLHLPHDSWEVGADNSLRCEIRHKPLYLLGDLDGWSTHRVAPPHDWAPTLAEEEVVALAGLARSLANRIGESAQLMVLARVDGRRGAKALLPFHFTRAHRSDARRADRGLPGCERESMVVATPADLTAIDASRPPRALLVRPAPEYLRDIGFLKSVSRWAADRAVPILFAGSVLGHAFHLLTSAGALVATVELHSREEPNDRNARVLAVVRRAGGLARVQTVPVSWLGEGHPGLAGTPFGFNDLPEVDLKPGQELPPSAPGIIPLFMDDAPHGTM